MSTMRAVTLDEWGGELAVETVDKPDPAPGEVRVEVKACGVTRTVENAIQGGLSDDPAFLPRIPGHEFAGVVDEVGEGVTNFVPGERVFAYFYLVCGTCDACRRGETNQCTNFDGWLGVQCDGAYAEYATVPGDNLLPLPDDASFIDGAMSADGLSTPLHLCNRTGLDDTDTVAVIGGAGRIGTQLTQLAARRGAHVLALDVTSDRLAAIDELASERGISNLVTAVDARGDAAELTTTLQAAAKNASGPSIVVDAVGDIGTLEVCWDALAMGGEVVSLTTHHDRVFAPPLKEFVVKEASVIGSRYASKDEVVRAARLLASDAIDATYSRRLSLEEVPNYHNELRAGETRGMAILEP